MDIDRDAAVALDLDLDLGGRRLRTLTVADAAAVAEATVEERSRSLWGGRPVGRYSPAEARTALALWEFAEHRQVSYGVFEHERMLAAVGLMLDDRGGAELAYWVRPESRRCGIAFSAVSAVAGWARDRTGLPRLWLEIDPANVASRRLARKAGFVLQDRIPDHCRAWLSEDPALDGWHDCLILVHPEVGAGAAV